MLKSKLFGVLCFSWIYWVLTVAPAYAEGPSPSFTVESPLTLELAHSLARKSSPLLSASMAAQEAARERVSAAKSRFYPRVDLTARYSRLSPVEPGRITLPLPVPEGQEPMSAQMGEKIEDSFSARLELTQPLFTGLGLYYGLEAAEKALALARQGQALRDADLELQITEAFLGAGRARAMLDALGAVVTGLKARHAQVQSLHEAGRLRQLDVITVAAKVSEVEANLRAAERQEAASRAALELLLGVPENSILAVSPLESLEMYSSDEGEPFSLEAGMQLGRAELLEVQAKAQMSRYYPQLFLRAGTTVANPNERHFPPKSEWNLTWDVSIVLMWQFDGLTSMYERDAIVHEQEEARATARQLELAAQIEYEREKATFEAALAQVDSFKTAVASRERARHELEALFSAGRITTTEVLDSEVALAQARLDVVNALFTVKTALARIKRTTKQ